jgi:hypothetical protein
MVHSQNACVTHLNRPYGQKNQMQAYATMMCAVGFILATSPLAKASLTSLLSFQCCLNLHWLIAVFGFAMYPFRAIGYRACVYVMPNRELKTYLVE